MADTGVCLAAAALAGLLLVMALPTAAQPVGPTDSARASGPDDALQAKLDRVVQGFDGRVGIYVRHLPTGRTAEVQADALFPTASMIKVPILLGVFQRLADGDLRYSQEFTYTDTLSYPGVDLLASFREGEQVAISKLILLMTTMSDNTASLWLQALAGGGTAINQWLEAHGVEHTRVNSRTPGREADYEALGWGQTTPREMAELLVRIRRGEAVSPAASAEMYRVLTRSYWDDEALSQIPPTVQAASKQGAVEQSRSEVVLVNAPSGDYVFCVVTADQSDTGWTYDNAGFALIREVSGLLWNHFEPAAAWTPPPDSGQFR